MFSYVCSVKEYSSAVANDTLLYRLYKYLSLYLKENGGNVA